MIRKSIVIPSITLILALITVYTLTDEFFQISEVTISGNIMISDDVIDSVASVEMMENIFLMDLNSVKNRLIELGPFKSVKVKRKLPDQISIEVVEKRIQFLVSSDQLWGLTLDGEFIPVTEGEIFDCPIITGFKNQPLPYKKIEEPKSAVIIDFLKAIGNNKYLSKISEIKIADNGEISIITSERIMVKLGESRFEYKMEILAGLFDRMANDDNRLVLIDLRYKSDAIVNYNRGNL